MLVENAPESLAKAMHDMVETYSMMIFVDMIHMSIFLFLWSTYTAPPTLTTTNELYYLLC